jgi:hypothetical protein
MQPKAKMPVTKNKVGVSPTTLCFYRWLLHNYPLNYHDEIFEATDKNTK